MAKKTNRAAVIYYPGRVDLKKVRRIVSAELSGLGWEIPLYLKTAADETGGVQALRAIAQKATHIIVIGGDGTVRSVIEEVAKSKASVTVGIVPIGTGNVLARNLNLPLADLELQIHRALFGNSHQIDLGLAKLIMADGKRVEKHFAVMAGIGLDAKIMMHTDSDRKRRLGWVAYVEGGLKMLPIRYETLSVSVDNREPRQFKVVTLLIGNVGWLPGRLSMMPEASLDDGRLDVAAIGPRRFWNWIDFWSRVTVGNNIVRTSRVGKQLLDATANVKTLENMSGVKIRVAPAVDTELQLDGDVIGKISEVEFEAQPRAVVVRS
ncbi:MAG: diacylglycerol/lipid kinase family protein [Micrococcales bacterium]